MKKPWPGDAIIAVCPIEGEEVRHTDFPTTPRNCRDCGAPLVVRVQTIATMENSPVRHGRPLGFFCIPCAVQYDAKMIQHFTDLRKGDDADNV